MQADLHADLHTDGGSPLLSRKHVQLLCWRLNVEACSNGRGGRLRRARTAVRRVRANDNGLRIEVAIRVKMMPIKVAQEAEGSVERGAFLFIFTSCSAMASGRMHEGMRRAGKLAKCRHRARTAGPVRGRSGGTRLRANQKFVALFSLIADMRAARSETH